MFLKILRIFLKIFKHFPENPQASKICFTGNHLVSPGLPSSVEENCQEASKSHAIASMKAQDEERPFDPL